MADPVCAIVGVGPGNGAAFDRAFRGQGYRTALLARRDEVIASLAAEAGSGAALALVCDATVEDQVADAFARVRAKLGPVEVLIYNAGSGRGGSIEDADATDLEAAWRTNVLGCFQAVRQVLPDMLELGAGTIVIIGATAALRGRAQTLAFASAKAAQRSLAQSMARHLGPKGIHVAYVVIDGVIDLQQTRQAMPDKADDFFLKPEDIAASVLALTRQPRSAWSFEIDLRPYGESW